MQDSSQFQTPEKTSFLSILVYAKLKCLLTDSKSDLVKRGAEISTIPIKTRLFSFRGASIFLFSISTSA